MHPRKGHGRSRPFDFSSGTADLIKMAIGIDSAAQAGEDSFAEDLAAIAKIDAAPMILDVVCQTTGVAAVDKSN